MGAGPTITLHHGDCREVMRAMDDCSVDSVICDPPYRLGFMGKAWDKSDVAFDPATWAEVLRVAKPGAMLLAFGGTRTYHRLVCAIEDAGWEIRDCMMWLYGSGFPKSHNISKAIDKAAGAEREVMGQRDTLTGADKATNTFMASPRMMNICAPATDAAKLWEGWGTALKPAWEPIVVAQKPMELITCAELYELTGRDWWHSVTGWKDTPKNRLRMRRLGIDLAPAYGEYKYMVRSRRALNAGAASDRGLVRIATRQWREAPEEEQLLGRFDRREFRRWSTGTAAANALKWGVAGLWIDGGRIGMTQTTTRRNGNSGAHDTYGKDPRFFERTNPPGRWPANLVLSHLPGCRCVGERKVKGMPPGSFQREKTSRGLPGGGFGQERADMRAKTDLPKPGYADADGTETVPAWECEEGCPVKMLDEQSGENCGAFAPVRRGHDGKSRGIYGDFAEKGDDGASFRADTGGASRFFYCSKASRSERTCGGTVENRHPTVKPLALMEYLCNLTKTPTGGVVLDPFMGSGTTGMACINTGRDFIGIEQDEESFNTAKVRIEATQAERRAQAPLFGDTR